MGPLISSTYACRKPIGWRLTENRTMLICNEKIFLRLIVWAVVDLFRSRAAIEAEVLTLRQQIIVLRRTTPKKQSFGAIDRLVFVGFFRRFPRVLDALVRPATVIKWHRAGLPCVLA